MSSEEKNDFERFRKMYRNKYQNASVHNRNNGSNEHQSSASSARVQQSVHVPYLASLATVSSASSPLRTIIDKRTYEQVFKGNLNNKNIYVPPEATRLLEPKHVPEPSQSSAEKPTQYTTTIYNITSHDVSNAPQSTGTCHLSDTVPTAATVIKPSISSIKPTMEGLKYQRSQSNVYAKHLIEITKNTMQKLDLPTMSETKNPCSVMDYKNPADTKNSSGAQTSSCVQIVQHHDIKSVAAGKPRPNSSYQGLSGEELYRHLQAPNPYMRTFAENCERLLISKQRSNIMVSIINPQVSSPAPVHVYGPSGIETTHLNSTEQCNRRKYESGTNVRKELNNVLECLAEPPPAHTTISKGINANFASSNAVAENNHSATQQYCQHEALNLDTKHNASQGDYAMKHEAVPHQQSSTDELAIERIVQTENFGGEKESHLVVPTAPSVPIQPTTRTPATLNAQQPIWEHLQNQKLQQLLSHVQATHQTLLSSIDTKEKSPMDQAKNNMQFMSSLHSNQYSVTEQPALPVNIDTQETDPGLMLHVNNNLSAITAADCVEEDAKEKKSVKRKKTTKDGDPAKKHKAKPKHKHPTEPYLQNGPCYKVASRLPRCRECGRSAATRTRHALNIFCRFYAFRKLKYNETGQLEVAGFADPNLDPKESDTSLWSSNLQQVPADLSIEKSKFLLGQVGYKFCELFHQEKEAHFEHLSEDKTIAWKQAVQGVREMCDVCQTTLFNHHWVCTSCGFVACIDCYKYRKHGISTIETTSKDKDVHGWLLCSSTKESHSQDRLMLTQIIPSNCLYKLVRQMHGVCALLEIPLNCECPLSKEPLFRKIKDKLEFIYPITVNGHTDETMCVDFNGLSCDSKITRMVSITIKSIEQVTLRDAELESNEPIECRIEFSKQFHENEKRQWRLGDVAPGSTANDTASDEGTNEKQSYSFRGFECEIHANGDFFDESLYKKTSTSKTAGGDLKPKESNKPIDEASDEKVQTANLNPNGNVSKSNIDLNADELCDGIQKEAAYHTACSNINSEEISDDANRKGAINTVRIASDEQRTANDIPMHTASCPENTRMLVVAPKKENKEMECDAMQRALKDAKESAVETESLKNKGATKTTVVTVPYSEEDRFKPSPPMDPKTFAMVVKQMVKFDKTIDIFSTFERHMSCESGRLANFHESIGVKPERVRQFLKDFLDNFVFLQGENSRDDLANERQILEYNRQIKDGLKFRNKGERKMHLNDSNTLYPDVAHEWLCNGKLLRLLDPLDVHNYRSFHDQWERGQPVMVSAVSSKMNMDLWIPKSFGRDFGEQVNDLINCFNGKIVRGHPMNVFWEGFEHIRERLVDERDRPMMLKLKDWPPGDDFAEMMPSRFYDLMKSLPLAEYTRREGRLNLTSRLSSFFVRPDLGPKMYSAYGSALHPNKGTTNLHLDISDAVNVMVHVGVPTDVPVARYNDKILEVIDSEDCDYLTRQRIRKGKEIPGALWHIYHAQHADKVRQLLNKIELERGGTIKSNHDPIHDQKWYLDRNMRRRLQQEYGVDGYAIVQCSGDAIFIPAGAPHQVRNLHNCIKVAEDFVSPENISYCFKLTNEFRHLSKTHSNHEDKLQIKNIIYHTVKDAVSSITNPLIMMARDRDRIDCSS